MYTLTIKSFLYLDGIKIFLLMFCYKNHFAIRFRLFWLKIARNRWNLFKSLISIFERTRSLFGSYLLQEPIVSFLNYFIILKKWRVVKKIVYNSWWGFWTKLVLSSVNLGIFKLFFSQINEFSWIFQKLSEMRRKVMDLGIMTPYWF